MAVVSSSVQHQCSTVAFDWPDMPLCSRASEDSRSVTLTLCFCSSRSNSAKKDVPPKAVKATPVVAEVVKTPKVSGVPCWLWNTPPSRTSCWSVVSVGGSVGLGVRLAWAAS